MRNSLSSNAKEYAFKTFSVESMSRSWEKIYDELMILPKRDRCWKMDKKNQEITDSDVFIESLGVYAKDFVNYLHAKTDVLKIQSIERIKLLSESPLWQASTRGTVHHYNNFFPKDKYLAVWSQIMKKNDF